MRNALGYILWLLAIAMTVVVVLSKFHLYQTPVVGDLLMKDSTSTLLVAILFALVSKWV